MKEIESNQPLSVNSKQVENITTNALSERKKYIKIDLASDIQNNNEKKQNDEFSPRIKIETKINLINRNETANKESHSVAKNNSVINKKINSSMNKFIKSEKSLIEMNKSIL